MEADGLERLLRYADEDCDASAVREQLRRRYGSRRAIYESESTDVARTQLLTPRGAQLIGLVSGLARYASLEAVLSRPLNRLVRAGRYLHAAYIGVHYEQLCVLTLDENHRMVACHAYTDNQLREALLRPRVIVNAALAPNVAALLLAHNHPGNTLHFSESDVSGTRDLLCLLAPLRIPILDHILVTDHAMRSMRKMHYIEEDVWLGAGEGCLSCEDWLAPEEAENENPDAPSRRPPR